MWTLVVGCGWLVGVTMQIIAGANCAPGPEFVRRLVRFSKQRSHVRIVSGAPEKQVPGVPGLWLVNWSKPAFCRCSLLLHTRPGEVVTSSVLKVAGSGNNFEDRGRPWSQGAGEWVRIFAPKCLRPQVCTFPRKHTSAGALTIPGASGASWRRLNRI